MKRLSAGGITASLSQRAVRRPALAISLAGARGWFGIASSSRRCPHPRAVPLSILSASVALLGFAASTHAASITWGAATNVSSDTDVSTAGSLFGAIALRTSDSTSPTVNGVTFTAIPNIVNALGGTLTSGNFSIGSFDNAAAIAGTAGSANYQALLTNQVSIIGIFPTLSLTMSGLTVGEQYQFQWWNHGSFADATSTATAGNAVTLSGGGAGQFALGTFVANATSQTIDFSVPGSVNAFQVRQIGPSFALWRGDQNGVWGTFNAGNTNWATNAGGLTDTAANPGPTTDVFFSTTGAANQGNTTLGHDFTIRSLTIIDTKAVSIGGTNKLTVDGAGIGVVAGAGAVTISARLDLATSNGIAVNNAAGMTISGAIGGTVGLDKIGTGTLTLTGTNTYTGGTQVDGGVLAINNANALGGGDVTLGVGAELRTTGTVTLADAVTFAKTGTSTLSTNGTLTVNDVHMDGPSANPVFGSAGNAGVVIIGPLQPDFSTFSATNIDVAFGTLRNGGGGGLDFLATVSNSTTVHAGATLSVNDQSMGMFTLLGAGAVTLGNNAATVLSVDAGFFSGVISGKGQLQTFDTVVLTGANTYTGGTTISTGLLQIGNGGTTGTIAGNVIDNSDLTFKHSNALTFAGKISGTGNVAQSGSGVLTLSGANTFTGDTFINSGVLAVNSASALSTGFVFLRSGGELRTSGTVTLPNLVIFAANGTSTVSTNGTLTLSAVNMSDPSMDAVFGSAGNAGVVVVAPLTSGSGIAFSTAIDVAFGTLRNGGGLDFLTSGNASTNVHAGATLSVNDQSMKVVGLQGAGAVSLGTKAATQLTVDGANFGGVISGSGQLKTLDTVVLTGANTYTGGTTIASGSLQIGNGGTTGALAGDVADSTSLIFNRNNALTFGGKISGSGTVTQAGTGVLTLTRANTYTGGTSINAGVVLINNGSALGTGNVTLATGTELRSTGTVTLTNFIQFAGTGTSTLSTNGTLTVNALVMAGASSNVIFGSAGNAGVVVEASGPGVANASATIDVAFGTLRNGGGLGYFTNSTASTNVHTGATLSVNDVSMTVNSLLGAGAVTLGTKAATTLTLRAGNFSGVISGAGQLSKNTSDSLTLSGANTYTGGTTISSGSLQIGNGGTTGAIAGDVTDSTSLIFNRSNALTFAGKISGSGTVTQNGSGVLTLSGVNSYTGGTSINAGVLAINNASALGTGGVTLTEGAELRSIGTVTLANSIRFAGGGFSTLSTNGTLTTGALVMVGASPNVVFGSTGNAGVVVVPAVSGLVSLTGITIDVAFGTLRNGGGLDLYTRNSDQTSVLAGATLDVHDSSMEVKNLLGAGVVTLGNNAATVLTLDAGNFYGVISGKGQLTKATSDALVLSGANTYTGGTTISAGALWIGNGGTTGAVVGDVTDNADLIFYRNNALTFAGKISGTGSVTQIGTGVLTLTGANTYTGKTFINAGVIAINNASALGTGPVTLAAGTELQSTGTVTLANGIHFALAGASTLSTNGTLTLAELHMDGTSADAVFGSARNAGVVVIPTGVAGSLDGSATIDVAFGTLRNGGGLDFFTSNTTSTTVRAGATLDVHDVSMGVPKLLGAGAVTLGSNAATVLTANAGTFSGVISGKGQLHKETSGFLTLSGANTYTGGTTIDGGTLVANNATNSTGTGPVTVNSTGTLGGSGKISGPITLNDGGVIQPGVASIGTAGTKLHGSSLLWNSGGALTLQLGLTADQLILSGALTKGTAGTFTLNVIDTGITASSYTLATFTSTNFTLADFTVLFPSGGGGTLTETATSLVLTLAHHERPAGGPDTPLPGRSEDFASTQPPDLALPLPETTDLSTPASFIVVPTPEPGSAALLACGAGALLGWRRRR